MKGKWGLIVVRKTKVEVNLPGPAWYEKVLWSMGVGFFLRPAGGGASPKDNFLEVYWTYGLGRFRYEAFRLEYVQAIGSTQINRTIAILVVGQEVEFLI